MLTLRCGTRPGDKVLLRGAERLESGNEGAVALTMRYMALRKVSRKDLCAEDADDAGSLQEPRYASVLPVNGGLTSVTIIDPPSRGPYPGACACEACRATRLTDLAIRFY